MRAIQVAMTALATMAAAGFSNELDANIDKPTQAQAVLARAAKASEAKDCGTVIRSLLPLVNSSPPALQPKLLAIGYDLLVSCEATTNHAPDAYAHALRATAMPESSDYMWRVRLLSELQAKQYPAAVTTVEAMAQGRGAALNGIPVRWLWSMQHDLQTSAQDALETRLLKILADPAYDPDDLNATLQATGDFARMRYARKLLAQGNRDAARTTIEGVVGLSALKEIVFTPELAALLPHAINLRTAVERELLRHRALLDRHPESLAAVNAVALDLRRLGRPTESVALLKSARSKIASAGTFVDLEDQLPWWWNELAMGQAASGAYDAMISSFSQGKSVLENGGVNVSQVINLAAAQLDYGRLDAALKTLAIFGDGKTQASGYGLMQVRGIRGCAFARAGRRDLALSDLDAAIATEKDDPRAVTGLLLCLGDEERAAASYLRRLGDPDLRADAMLDLSDYDSPDPRVPPDPTLKVLAAVRARTDVTAAIARAGGHHTIHLQRGTVF